MKVITPIQGTCQTDSCTAGIFQGVQFLRINYCQQNKYNYAVYNRHDIISLCTSVEITLQKLDPMKISVTGSNHRYRQGVYKPLIPVLKLIANWIPEIIRA